MHLLLPTTYQSLVLIRGSKCCTGAEGSTTIMENPLNDFTDYVVAVLPLVIGQLTFPPMSYFLGENPPNEWRPLFEIWYEIIPRSVKSFDLVQSMTLLDTDKVNGWSPNMITSLFVHYNFDHLLRNLSGLILTGYRVFLRAGPNALYSIFLTGGVAASLPVAKFYEQVISALSKGKKDGASNTASLKSQLLSLFPENIAKMQESVLSTLKKATSTRYMGSSGAICALMGYEYTCAFVESAKIVYHLAAERHQTNRKKKRRQVLVLLNNAWTLYAYSVAMHNDWVHLQSPQQAPQSLLPIPSIFFTFFGSQGSNATVDHSCHLQGFGFGALLGMGHLALSGLRLL